MQLIRTIQGAARLGFDLTDGVTGVVEGMYRNISSLPFPLGEGPQGRAPGIAGLVHETIRQVNGLVRNGVDPALELLHENLEVELGDTMQSDAILSALNGVVGDHLERSDNPLAIKMQMVFDETMPGEDLLVLVHGLAMHHSFFKWKGHNHADGIVARHGFTPVYLHYNTGRHVSTNGKEFADQIEKLIDDWPRPVRSIRFIGYSMGGLLTRSALHAAAAKGHRWPELVCKAVYLASPHHGSAIERGGNWFQAAFGISPYSSPLKALGMVRSAGITDLRHGNVVDEDWESEDRFKEHGDRRKITPLSAGIEHFAIAGLIANEEDFVLKRALGDGLISEKSAFGDHKQIDRCLGIPEQNRLLVQGAGHLELLAHPEVFDRLCDWLAPVRA